MLRPTSEPPAATSVAGDVASVPIVAVRARARTAAAGVGGKLAVGFLVLTLVASYLLPLVLSYGPNEQELTTGLLPPVPLTGSSWSHPLGTDQLGRDVLARLVEGARISLTVSLVAVAIAAIFGALVGALAGFVGGWVDFLVQAWIEVQISFPGLLMAVLFLALIGATPTALVAFLAITGWLIFARAARAGVLSQREQEHVHSAYAVGASHGRVLFRHIVPALRPTLAVIAALELAQNMLAESALSFLGLGIQPPGVSWGLMMAEGRNYMTSGWWLIVLPGLAIILAVLSVMALAEVCRRRLQEP